MNNIEKSINLSTDINNENEPVTDETINEKPSEEKDIEKNEEKDEEIGEEIGENISSSLNNKYNLKNNSLKESVLNFGNYFKLNLNSTVIGNLSSYVINKSDNNSDPYYKPLNFEKIYKSLHTEKIIILNDSKGKGKFYTAIYSMFELDEIKKIYVLNPSEKYEHLLQYEFKQSCGYIVECFNDSENLNYNLKYLKTKIAFKENIFIIIIMPKEHFDTDELEIDNISSHKIKVPDIREAIENYIDGFFNPITGPVSDWIEHIINVLGKDFIKNLTFEKIPKIAEDIYNSSVEYDFNELVNREDDEKNKEIRVAFKKHKTNAIPMVKKFFKKNISEENNSDEMISLVTVIALFENTDYNFIIEKSIEFYKLISSDKTEKDVTTNKENIPEINYLLARKNFSIILNDIWAEEVEVKRDENETCEYGCEKIKVLKFNNNELREEYLNFIWNKYIGLRQFILKFFSNYDQSSEDRNTISLIKALAILAKYDIESILGSIKLNWIENISKEKNTNLQRKRINAAFLISTIYQTEKNKRNIEIFLKNLQNSKKTHNYKKVQELEMSIFVYSLLVVDGFNLISLDDLLKLYKDRIFNNSFGELSNFIKHAFFILVEGYCKNNNSNINNLFEFFYISMKDYFKKPQDKKTRNHILNLFLYQIKKYLTFINIPNKKNIQQLRIKKIITFMLIECLKDAVIKIRTFKILNDLFSNIKKNNLQKNTVSVQLKYICGEISSRLNIEDRISLIKCIKGEYKDDL